MPDSVLNNRIKKSLCPFQHRYCTTYCEFVGQFIDCPLTLRDKVYSELREGHYRGLPPHKLLRKVRDNE